MAQTTIEKIRNAEGEADEIINNANARAQQIIKQAELDSKQILDKARLDALDFDKRECDAAQKTATQLFEKDDNSLSEDLSKQRNETLKKEQEAIKAVLNAIV